MAGALIGDVEVGSLAAELGLQKGDRITRVNGSKIKDLIQFQFEWAGEEVTLEIQKDNGETLVFELEKAYDQRLGVSFEEAVFDRIKKCGNRCVFCFVDQMPRGMRPSLYIKDDDYRLSFLQGSFVTLTNLKERDMKRIKEEHLSPLHVSVHTTDPALRVALLKNPRAGEILQQLRELSQAGIEFHTQVVLCPGLNDDAYLEKTYTDLLSIPGVQSLAVVPVGITQHREHLEPLRVFHTQEAAAVLDWIEERQKQCLDEKGTAFIWGSDEFYLAAKRPLPPGERYEDYPQLENGVGLVRLLWDEFDELALPQKIQPPQKLVFATGVSGERAIRPLIDRLNAIEGLDISLQVIENVFFGPSVTVSGLLTGCCLSKGLANLPEGSTVFIPSVMLREGDQQTLDDFTPAELEKKLKIKIISVEVNARAILDAIMKDQR